MMKAQGLEAPDPARQEKEEKTGAGSPLPRKRRGDLGGEVFACSGVEFARAPFDAEAGAILELGDDVEVDVHDGLVGGGAVVLEDVEGGGAGGLHDGAADAWQHAADGGGGVVAELVERDGGFLGDDERVATAERADVEEGEGAGVLVDFVAGDLAADDLAEDGVWHGGW
jgi:hypothetical protein